MSDTQPRSRLRSLVGMRVFVTSLDGVQRNRNRVMFLEEISEYGLLLRNSEGKLVFASSASFRIDTEPSEQKYYVKLQE